MVETRLRVASPPDWPPGGLNDDRGLVTKTNRPTNTLHKMNGNTESEKNTEQLECKYCDDEPDVVVIDEADGEMVSVCTYCAITHIDRKNSRTNAGETEE